MMLAIQNTVIFIGLITVSVQSYAAGGVVGEDGSCMIEIGFYTAHFSIYQPKDSANTVFCEDLPATGKTVFVMDYLHASLQSVPVDFRIIKDVQGFGQFVRWENIAQIDIEGQTVFFQPPEVHPDERMAVEYTFSEPGNYIGVVTAPHPTKDIMYRAVFPFEVGNTGYGYWPIILVLILALQAQFMMGGSWFARLRAKFARS